MWQVCAGGTGDSRLPPSAPTDDERVALVGWASRRSTAQGLALRARIVSECAQGHANRAVAARSGVARGTVSGWRGRFVADGLDGLGDEPRPGVLYRFRIHRGLLDLHAGCAPPAPNARTGC
ncbi:helix-turn-helix domain-containing protein [Streptosporangium roseum]|uniref:helix-turn-helix domain-containing protein n=1 Tax=Streptosporangium roseum TaxID=2001 RepID=UPI003331C779